MSLNGKTVQIALIGALATVIIGSLLFFFGYAERTNKAEAEMFIKRIEACDTKNAEQDEVMQEVLECQAETRTDIKYIREDISEIKELLKN